MVVDISRGWRKYSKGDLLKFMDSGILVCGKFELGDFLSYMVDGVEEEIYQRGFDEGYAVGWEQGRYYGELEGGD